jgi:hypothetical protein
MRQQNAASLVLDHTHCRAICDEIGERLGFIMKPVTSDLPPRLRYLIGRLAELEKRDLLQPVLAPSIMPSIEEMTLPVNRVAVDAG